MKPTRILAALAMSFALGTLAPAQDPLEKIVEARRARQQEKQESNVEKRDNLVLAYFAAKSDRAAGELASSAHRLLGRDFQIAGAGGRVFQNITPVGASVAVYDTKAAVSRILEELPRMAKAYAADVPEYKTVAYTLEHITARNLRNSLSSFMRQLSDSGRGGQRQGMGSPNLSIGSDSVLVVRETPERQQQIGKLIATLDVPPRRSGSSQQGGQITLRCYVIRTAKAAPDNAAPEDLAKHLSVLTGADHFESLGGAVARASGNGTGVTIDMELDDELSAGVALEGLSFDRKRGLRVRSLSFRLQQQQGRRRPFSLQTSATLSVGEYTVVGGYGSTPCYFVIRVDAD